MIAVDGTACGEVGSLDILHKVCHGNLFRFGITAAVYLVLNVCHTAVYDFAEVVGGHIRCHTDSNTGGSVYEQIGETAGQHSRLTQGVVEVKLHINGVLVNVAQHLLGKFAEARFGITHSGCTVAVFRTEVTLSVHKQVAHIPRLCHTHERTIYTAVSVGVVLTHNFTHDTSGFFSRFVGCIAKFVHSEKYTALNGFEAIAHIGQGTTDDDTHRIVDIRGFHFLVYLYGNNSVF